MKRMFWLAAVTAVLFFSVASTPGMKNPGTQGLVAKSGQDRHTEKSRTVSAEEEQELRKFLAERRAAFDRRDFKTACLSFAEDADFINVGGSWRRGKQEICKFHETLSAGVFKHAHLREFNTWIRFITPGVAIAHTSWELTGEIGQDGSPVPPRQGIATFVAVKEKGRWVVEVANNNNFASPNAKKFLPGEMAAPKP